MLAFIRSTRTAVAVVSLAVTGMLATQTVRVAPGDTLSELGARHGVSVADLAALNGLDDPDFIRSGDTLIVRADTSSGDPTVYVVRGGDTLSELAGRFRGSIATLVALNRLADPDVILVGQRLTVAGDPPASDPPASGPPESERSAADDRDDGADRDAEYVVRPGDTLAGIARQMGVGATDLARLNDIIDPDRIFVGQRLIVRDGASEPPPTTTTTPLPPPPTTTAPPTTTTAPPATTTTTPLPPSPTTTAPPATTTTGAAAPAPEPATGLAGFFDKWSTAYGVDRSLLEALLWKESGWRADVVGPDGHLGIGQMSPDSVEFVEERLLGLDLDPLDASDGIQMAARLLRYLRDRTDDDRTALAAWNQGLNGVLTDGVSTAAGAFADDVLAIRRQRA